MVTDRQYKEAIDRIDDLEKKVNMLSRSLAEMKMRVGGSTVRHNLPGQEPKRDITKYVFNGAKYSKRDLVLAVVKKYVSDNSVQSATLVEDVFPDHLQGSLGVIRRATEAEAYIGSENRYFFGDDDVLKFDEGIYVVCREWTVKNIPRFIKVAESLGYEINPIIRDY